MKLIIAGGRDYTLTQEDCDFLDTLRAQVTEVVSGGARGADRGGEIWAEFHGIPVTQFPANWSRLGRKAGFLRNAQMAQYADAVVLFPGGNGTDNMAKNARGAAITIYDRRRAA